jgi:hypothetical protein
VLERNKIADQPPRFADAFLSGSQASRISLQLCANGMATLIVPEPGHPLVAFALLLAPSEPHRKEVRERCGKSFRPPSVAERQSSSHCWARSR